MEKLSVKNRQKIAEMLFWSAFAVILFVDYVSATYVTLVISGRLQQLAILLLAGKIVLTRYSWKEWIIIGVLGVLSAISFWQTKNYYACELFMLVIASKEMELKRAVKIYLAVVGTITVLAAAASILGIFGEVSQLANFRGDRGAAPELRYCFGYKHPNVCHIVFLQLVLSFVWLCYERLQWYALIFLAGVNIFLGVFTDSRTGMLLGTFLFFFLAASKIWPSMKEKTALYLLSFVALAGSIVLSVLAVFVGTESPALAFVNRLWTGRILYAYIEAGKSVPSLFSGMELQISCDMGLVKLFYNYGIIIFVVFLLLLVGKLLQNRAKRDVAELMVLLAGMFFLLGETFSSGEFITRNIIIVFMIGMWPFHFVRKEENTEAKE